MRNYTDFSDQAVLSCIREHGGNPSKCTFIEQLSCMGTGSLRRILSLWQDNSQDWDCNDALLCSIPVEQWNFWKAPKELTKKDALAMMDFYQKAYDPYDFNCRDMALIGATVKQLLDALALEYPEVSYDESSRTFKVIEYIQKPGYDDGGSIDHIVIEKKKYDIPWVTAEEIYHQQLLHEMYDEQEQEYLDTLWSLRF